MRDLTHSLSRFSWVMSLFGFKQLANLMTGDGSGGPEKDPMAAFEAVGGAAQNYLGDALMKIFETGDRMLRTTVDTFFGWQPENPWLSTHPPFLDQPGASNQAHNLWGDPSMVRPTPSDSSRGPYMWPSTESPSTAALHNSDAWIGGWGPMPQPSAQSPEGPNFAVDHPDDVSGVGAADLMSTMHDPHHPFGHADHQASHPEAEAWDAVHSMFESGLSGLETGLSGVMPEHDAMNGGWGPMSSDAPLPEGEPEATVPEHSMVGGWGPMSSDALPSEGEPEARVPELSMVGGWGPMPAIPDLDGARS